MTGASGNDEPVMVKVPAASGPVSVCPSSAASLAVVTKTVTVGKTAWRGRSVGKRDVRALCQFDTAVTGEEYSDMAGTSTVASRGSERHESRSKQRRLRTKGHRTARGLRSLRCTPFASHPGMHPVYCSPDLQCVQSSKMSRPGHAGRWSVRGRRAHGVQ